MESEKEATPDDPETGTLALGAAGGGEDAIEVPVALPVSDGGGLVTAKAEEGEFFLRLVLRLVLRLRPASKLAHSRLVFPLVSSHASLFSATTRRNTALLSRPRSPWRLLLRPGTSS